MPNAFQEVVDALNLEAATRRGSERNDLLPPRHEDGVAGELGKRFSEGLRMRLERGRYDPSPAVFVYVPKPGNTTRPAALLTLADRVIYDALVDVLRPRIDAALLGPDIVYWPRGTKAEKRWREFESAPLARGSAYVARADITGFYECIDHEVLRETLMDITGRRAIVNALIEFLGRVMGAGRGVPQGLAASDPVATAYLHLVDASMSRECLDYYRNGDDIRIASGSLGDARKALYVFELELRRRNLLANNSKSIIMRAESYRAALEEGNRITEETKKALLQARIDELEDPEKIQELLDKAGRDDLGWAFFYHGTVSFSDLVNQLADHVTPSDTEVAASVFLHAISCEPGTLSPEAFHQRISTSLVRLAAGDCPEAIPYASTLIARFPEKTEIVASYLLALDGAHAPRVVAEVTNVLTDGRFHTDWEKAWLLRVLVRFVPSLQPGQIDIANRIASDEDESPFSRVAALTLLARAGHCEHLLVRRLWNLAPICFHPDLVAAAYYARGAQEWCRAFLAGATGDPVNGVVLKHLEAN
jgi:hypothetical protein